MELRNFLTVLTKTTVLSMLFESVWRIIGSIFCLGYYAEDMWRWTTDLFGARLKLLIFLVGFIVL